MNCQEKGEDFAFIFSEKEIKIKSFFAEFVSPIISHLHHCDPTINALNFDKIIIENKDQSNFSKDELFNSHAISQIIQLSQGNPITLDEKNTKEIKDILFFSILLGNEELYSKVSQKIKKTKSDKIAEIQLYNQILKTFPMFSNSTLIDELAREISSKDEEELKKLPRLILYLFIQSDQFNFDDPDKLFDIVNFVFSKNKEDDNDNCDDCNQISYFYEIVDVSKLNSAKFKEFLVRTKYTDLTSILWKQIIEYFNINQSTEHSSRKNKCVCEYDGKIENRFKGILYNLNTNKNINICDEGIIDVTSTPQVSNHSPKDAFDFNSDNYSFCNTPDDYRYFSWIKIDFKDKKIRPTHYSIKTRNDSNRQNPQNWCIEVSNSNNDDDWKIIDERKDVTSISKQNQSNVFEIKMKLSPYESYRYIRIRQTGPTTDNCSSFAISSLEFFGTLIK